MDNWPIHFLMSARIGKYKEIQTKLLKRVKHHIHELLNLIQYLNFSIVFWLNNCYKEHKSRAEASALVARLASTIPKPAPSANFVTDGQTPTPIPIANSAPRGRTSAPTPTANSFACVNSAICVSAPTQAPNANSVASVRTWSSQTTTPSSQMSYAIGPIFLQCFCLYSLKLPFIQTNNSLLV